MDEVHYPECYFEQDWEQTEEQTNVGRETAGFSRIWNFSCILLELATWYADSSAQYSQRTAGSSVSLSLALCYCGPQGLQHKPTFARAWARWERFKSVSTSPSNALIHAVQKCSVFSNYLWWVKHLIFLNVKVQVSWFFKWFQASIFVRSSIHTNCETKKLVDAFFMSNLIYSQLYQFQH